MKEWCFRAKGTSEIISKVRETHCGLQICNLKAVVEVFGYPNKREISTLISCMGDEVTYTFGHTHYVNCVRMKDEFIRCSKQKSFGQVLTVEISTV